MGVCLRVHVLPSLWWSGCYPCASWKRAAPRLGGTPAQCAVCVCKREWWWCRVVGSRRWTVQWCRSGQWGLCWMWSSRYSRLSRRAPDHNVPSGPAVNRRTLVRMPMHTQLAHARAHDQTCYLLHTYRKLQHIKKQTIYNTGSDDENKTFQVCIYACLQVCLCIA